jgi:hypothetical protein
VTYDQWEEAVPDAIRGDTLWRVEAYRLGLFLSDLVWHDAGKLLRNPRSREVADQLFRAAGKIQRLHRRRLFTRHGQGALDILRVRVWFRA